MLKTHSALECVEAAIKILENDPLVNAGYGSNLTTDSKVECDASIMTNHGFGACGAVRNVKNPISLARKILEMELHESRIKPMLLVGEGAARFAAKCNLESAILETEKAQLTHEMFTQRMDTVGAICIDSDGNIAAGVSSGGILLKIPGRVGSAAMYGAGCFTTSTSACSASGSGETLIKAKFSQTVCEQLEREEFDFSKILSEIQEQQFGNVGFIAIHKIKEKTELWFGHTTKSFSFAFKTEGKNYSAVSEKKRKYALGCHHL